MQKDNSTLPYKVSLRRNLLKEIEHPVVMETHGGYGAIWRRCYSDIESGVVFEQLPEKAEALARQRPTWAVYECDCEGAIRAGVGFHVPVNFIDLDPYGSPWPVVDVIFSVEREWPPVLAIAVNDGLRQKVKATGGWDVAALSGIVAKYGAARMYDNYLPICQELLTEKAGWVGYHLTRWAGYYCGYLGQMTHYAAILRLD
jgi:hypothetical protein